jgi:hypothetical protein
MRANSSAVNSLLNQLYNAAREEKVDQPGKLSDWGLEPPQVEITITRKDGKVFKVNLGNTNESGEVYALDPSNPKHPMVVKKSSLSAALLKLDDFRNPELLASAASELQAVTLRQDKDTVAWKKDGAHWMYTEPKGFGEAQNGFETPPPVQVVMTPGSIQTVLTDIANLKVEKSDKGDDYLDDQ